MELKDVILSTIAELGEESVETKKVENSSHKVENEAEDNAPTVKKEQIRRLKASAGSDFVESEREFLQNLRERILVLFEGFQSPNNKRVEAKIDLTLNFLEYLLATLDERIETLRKL